MHLKIKALAVALATCVGGQPVLDVAAAAPSVEPKDGVVATGTEQLVRDTATTAPREALNDWVVAMGVEQPVRDPATAAPAGPENTREQVIQYGVGAKLKVKLIRGEHVEGSVASIQDDGFEFGDKRGGSTRLIAYDSVRELRPVGLVYRAKGTPDAVEARRVVRGLGTGHHIQVRTSAHKDLIHGNIQSIGTDSFTMVPDRASTPVEIAFTDTHYIEQNLSKGAQIAIIAGAATGIAILIWFLTLDMN